MKTHISAAALAAAEADAPPPVIGVAEVPLMQINGFAVSEDGATIGLRGVDGMGQAIVVTFPVALGAMVIGATTQGIAQSDKVREAAGGGAIEQNIAVVHPTGFQVAPGGEAFDGVMLVFNPGAADMACFGLPLGAVPGLMQALAGAGKVQHESRRRLIVPKT